MILKGFRTYELAVAFHKQCKALNTPAYLRDQLLRSSSSIVLNLAEGSAKQSIPDRRRFYGIALASLRESQAILDLLESPTAVTQADQLGAHLYRLVHPAT